MKIIWLPVNIVIIVYVALFPYMESTKPAPYYATMTMRSDKPCSGCGQFLGRCIGFMNLNQQLNTFYMTYLGLIYFLYLIRYIYSDFTLAHTAGN